MEGDGLPDPRPLPLCQEPGTDELTYLIERSPALTDLRDELPGLSLRRRIAAATDTETCISAQALATSFSVGTDKITSSELKPIPECLENTFDALRDAGLSSPLS